MTTQHTQEFPGGSLNEQGTLRIKIRAWEMLKQNLQPRDIDHIRKGALLCEWNMIAPNDIQEQMHHSWEEYSSIQGRMANTLASALNATQNVNQTTKATINSAKKIIDGYKDGALAGGMDPAKNAMNNLMTEGQVISPYKVDSPLAYVGSLRREYSFTFQLMEFRNIHSDVIAMIEDFRRFSCASIGEGRVTDQMEWPAIFEVYSSPSPFVWIPETALTDVQTTYKAPYKMGHPQWADLTLTFKDLRPLYRSSWGKTDGKVSVEMARGRDRNAGDTNQRQAMERRLNINRG